MTGSLDAAPVGSAARTAFMPVRIPRRGVDASLLGLILLAAVFFPRIGTAVGLPSALNFAHFALAIPFAALALPQMGGRAVGRIVVGLLGLFASMCASALLNGGGPLNVLLDFLLLSEPFVFLLLLVSEPMRPHQLVRFRSATLVFAVVHVALGLVQALVLGRIHDDVKGVFLGQGAGHHVGGAVALATAGYVLFGHGVPGSRWLRLALAVGCCMIVVLSDSKQVVAGCLAALLVVASLRVRDVRGLLLCIAITAGSVPAIWALRSEIPVLSLLTEDWRVLGGLEQKASIGGLLLSYGETPAHWALGLGPGHTVGRLGTSLLDYRAHLEPLGATLSPITREAIRLREASEFSSTSSQTGSSVWSPLFFWAGLIGDLGMLGLAAYLWLWIVVWRDIAHSALSQTLILGMFALGVLFSWLEEPSYMLFIVAIVALEWQGRVRAALARGAPS